MLTSPTIILLEFPPLTWPQVSIHSVYLWCQILAHMLFATWLPKCRTNYNSSFVTIILSAGKWLRLVLPHIALTLLIPCDQDLQQTYRTQKMTDTSTITQYKGREEIVLYTYLIDTVLDTLILLEEITAHYFC